jgi:hypothetical protein
MIRKNVLLMCYRKPVGGKFGLEGNATSSTNPKFVIAADGLSVENLVCGYGHCCMVVTRGEGQSQEAYDEKMSTFPEFDIPEEEEKAGVALADCGKKGAAIKGKGKKVLENNKRKKEPVVSKAKRGKK